VNKEPLDPYNQNSWNALAAAAQKGDKKAYHALLTGISPYIRNYLIGGLATPDWAEDITQEALISIHKALNTYAPNRPFKPWMMAIANFRRTDFLRKHYNNKGHKQTTLDDVTFQTHHVTNPDHAGEYKDIESALGEIPKKQRKVFEMIKIQGFTVKEVAKEMDMTESAVKVSAHRTMNKLKEKLQ